MKLDEFEIGQFCAGVGRERNALAEAAGGISAVEKQAADAAGRDHDAIRRDGGWPALTRGEHAPD